MRDGTLPHSVVSVYFLTARSAVQIKTTSEKISYLFIIEITENSHIFLI